MSERSGSAPASVTADAEPVPAARTPEEVSKAVVATAVWAPSVHNTQPWWFSHEGRQLGVHSDAERRLPIADPDGREMMISCGAALFTARVALRALGYVAEASILPDPDLPNLVARIRWDAKVPPSEYERQLYEQVTLRHTHRGGFEPVALPAELLAVLREAAGRDNATLRIVAEEDRRAALAAAVETAEYAIRLDGARAHEVARWARPPDSKRLDGVRPDSYPARQDKTEPNFPNRDFALGRGWGHEPAVQAPLLKSAGVTAVLCTKSDTPADWVNAGQALQRVLLSATMAGTAAALHSQPLEFPLLREFLRTQLCDGAYPQMVLRIGSTGQRPVSVRRPPGQVLL